jgi:hypothetical protein
VHPVVARLDAADDLADEPQKGIVDGAHVVVEEMQLVPLGPQAHVQQPLVEFQVAGGEPVEAGRASRRPAEAAPLSPAGRIGADIARQTEHLDDAVRQRGFAQIGRGGLGGHGVPPLWWCGRESGHDAAFTRPAGPWFGSVSLSARLPLRQASDGALARASWSIG